MENFDQRYDHYKRLIDTDIDSYAQALGGRTREIYGEASGAVSDAYTNLLTRGGKRLRGVLTMVGYEMCGGTNTAMIVQAARAIEMMHVYMLVVDDIQDRSQTRRGGLSTHVALGQRFNDPHTGTALALNAALLGSHSAGMVMGMLDVPDEQKVKALNILNNTVVVTSHGQTNDIVSDGTQQTIDHVLQWKSAHYTFLNPLHTGMVLAGAGCEDTNGITQFALSAGKAFQIADDLLVLDTSNDKNPMDDIVEGKQTLLTLYLHEHGTSDDKRFLAHCLGNRELSPDDFARCQQLFVSSGAAQHVRAVGEFYASDARSALEGHAVRWSPESVLFLDTLVNRLSQKFGILL